MKGMSRAVRHVLAASVLGLGLVATSFVLSGCDLDLPRSCTEMAGESGLSLTVRTAGPGTYDIIVRSDLVEASCRMINDGTVEGTTFEPCAVRRGEVYPSYFGSGALTLSGSYSQNGIQLPSVVDVRVLSKAGTELAHETLRPSYSEHYPNGPECDAYPARYAQETVWVMKRPGDTDAGREE